MILCNLDDLWVAGMGIAYWVLTAFPALAAVGFGWMIYVVKLMVREIKASKS